ncbi:MAG TPA: TolC family protein [Planctomycetaceae bacterium]|jgi:outer membrane protein TolC|nr:TolC family protein [Planctomycetaceae bacterium]
MAAILIAVLGGCSASPKPLTYVGHADLEYYKGLATKVDYPDKTGPDNCGAIASQEPPLVRHPRKEQLWDMSLGQAIRIALQNNKIIRSRDQFLLPRNPLVSNPEQVPSVFDPGVQETGILFGQRGVEAALSDFDATFTTNLTYNWNTVAENNGGLSGVPTIDGLPTLVEDTAQYRARLDKTFADSSTLSFINEWDYTHNNVQGNLFSSVFTGFARAEFRRPLLAGGGTEYTRIAGPIGKNPAGVGQGVVISRINGDIALADFEASVHQLIRDVQTSYWDLSLAYQTYHAQVVYRNSALRTWEQISAKRVKGLPGGTTPDETQARENYFDAKGQAEQALSNLYTTEGQFRRLLGLTVSDGRIIRPCEEPSVAEFIPDWHIAVAEGIARRPEIRRQKWNIKALEMQLTASKSLEQPRLDLVAGGQVNAFGNNLISQQSILNQPHSSAFASLVDFGQTGWDIGFEASIPIGFRNARSQERNFELRLARARAALYTQELDISHEVRNAFQTLDRAYAVAQSAFNRRVAAAQRVEAYKAQYELRGTTADPLLRSQQSLVQAEVAYDQALIQYNQAITDYYYRTGTILAESNISIAEDMWNPKAYSDALREAWARSHGTPNPFVKTEPAEFVVPPGRPTSNLPPVATSLSSPMASPASAGPNSDSTSPPPTPPLKPQPDQPPPRQPAHSAFLAPAVWPQSPSAGPPNIQETPAFLAPAGSVLPASFFSPELGTGASSRAGDAKNRIAAAAAAPALFESPSPATEAMVLPVAPGQSSAWSLPQVGRAAPRAAAANEEMSVVPASGSDSFEMPVKGN